MSAHTLPTDSIQRRHFEQVAASVGLGAIPEDSIQRRHYLQVLDSRLEAARPASAVAREGVARAALAGLVREPSAAKAAASPSPAQAPRPAPPPAAAVGQAPKGWFGRLMERLFGS